MSNRNKKSIMLALLLSGMTCMASGAVAQSQSQGEKSKSLGSSWADAEKMPDLFSGMWMTMGGMVESDKSLNVPYTEKAQKYVDAWKPKRDIPYAEDGCLSPGLPITMRSGPIKFAYSPGLISIYMQGVGHTRFIHMNQAHDRPSPKYYGNSVGRWEGDTLVVETVDFVPEISFQYGVGEGLPPEGTLGLAPGADSPFAGVGAPGAPGPGAGGPPPGAFPPPGGFPPGGPLPDGPPPSALDLSKAIWGPPSESMRMVERMRMVDRQTMEHSLTLYDDTVWKQPFVAATRRYRRIEAGISEFGPFSGLPEEWVCTVSITSFDPETNSYVDKDPEEMVKFLEKLGR